MNSVNIAGYSNCIDEANTIHCKPLISSFCVSDLSIAVLSLNWIELGVCEALPEKRERWHSGRRWRGHCLQNQVRAVMQANTKRILYNSFSVLVCGSAHSHWQWPLAGFFCSPFRSWATKFCSTTQTRTTCSGSTAPWSKGCGITFFCSPTSPFLFCCHLHISSPNQRDSQATEKWVDFCVPWCDH